MPINVRIVADDASELGEQLRDNAKQVDGKWVVDGLPEGFAIENVKGLRSALQAERAQRKDLEGRLQPYVDAGLEPDDLPTAAEALQKFKAGQLRSSDDIERYRAEIQKKATTEIEGLKTVLDKKNAALRAATIQQQLSRIIAAKGGQEAIDAIMTLAERRIQVNEDAEGNLVPVVVGDDGRTPALTKKAGSTDPMGLDELIDAMRDSPATRGLFKVQVAGGSGSNSQASGRPAASTDGALPSSRELILQANEKVVPRGAAG